MTAPTGSTGGQGLESKLSFYLSILQAGGSLLANPTLGIQGAGRIVALIGYAGTLVRDIAVGADQLRAVNNQIGQLVSEKRPPSEGEWKAWEDRLAQVDARFQRVKESLGGS